jgi:hypothetical protein
MIGVSLLVFPRLALGLSGFETGVSIMPLVRGDTEDDPERPEGRIRNSRKMLLVAALIMYFYLLTRSFVTTLLIPESEFDPNDEAQGRALAYVAQEHLGNAIGTIYYISTITILWFAGASAMAGLLNVVPRYLPGNGTEKEYARKEREQREDNHIPREEQILFLEVQVEDASEFMEVLEVRGVEVGGHQVLRCVSSVVPNAIAVFLLHLRDTTGKTPHCYFGWTEGNPSVYLIRYILFGEGDTAPLTHEVLREAEPNPERCPAIYVSGR